MKKILAIAHSYYTLLVLINLREIVYKEDMFDLIIMDVSKESEQIYHNICNSGIFCNCKFMKESDLYIENNANYLNKLKVVLNNTINTDAVKREMIGFSDFKYDLFLTYVTDRVVDQFVFYYIKEKNPKAICELYEEGYASYFDPHGIFVTRKWYESSNLIPYFAKILGKKSKLISNNVTASWTFNPKLILYDSKFEKKRIPNFMELDKAIVNQINDVFSFDPIEDKIDGKYVFLEDTFTKDDINIVNSIANIIGKENCIIKLHPATKENRWKKLGYTCIEKNFPLELYLLNTTAENIVLLTVGSGAPLMCMIGFGVKNKVAMLYKLSKFKYAQINSRLFTQFIKKISDEYGEEKFYLIEKREEVCQL